MVKNCCAVGCHNVYKKGSGIHFYRFPTEPDRRAKWVSAIHREGWVPTKYSWLCSEHFVTGKKSNNPLAPNFIPTIFKHISSPQKRRLNAMAVSFDRRQTMKRKREESSEPSHDRHEEGLLGSPEGHKEQPSTSEIQQLQSYYEEASKCKEKWELEQRCKELEKKCEDVCQQKQVLQIVYDNFKSTVSITGETLANDNKKVRYYTGLPSHACLKAIYDFVSIGLPNSFSNGKKAPFEQFLIALVKLRLSLGDQDLSYRFGISQATVSNYFGAWIDVMYTRLSSLISWPERSELMKTMPSEFRKHFRKCVVIIDCFEIFIERPTSLTARAQTWSNYKHHNTVKFLIGITPQGSVAFISQGWGGRTSDVHLTENSGLLQKLLPGDIVLVDRGFTIQEAAGLYCAEVKLPPFTRGKRQLSKIEVDAARRLSRVRIHVERIIGLI